MKVYVVWDVTYELVVGVFSDFDDADEYCSLHREDNLCLGCFEVDSLCHM